MRNGNDVYLEKPMAETMKDARALLKAVNETGKIVQIGPQCPHCIAANSYIRSGSLEI